MVDAAMVFAAGFGTRMGALTQDRPKPMIPLNGRPMIDHALDHLDQAGIGRVVVNTHYKACQIASHLADRPISISHEHPDILETGGGLKQALPLLGDGPVLTLNSDTIWTGGNPVDSLRAAWDPARMRALLLLVPVARAQMYKGPGDFDLDPSGQAKRRSGETAAYAYCGAHILDTMVLADFDGSFSLNAVWDHLAKEGTLFATVHPGGFVDVGTPAGIPVAEEALRNDV